MNNTMDMRFGIYYPAPSKQINQIYKKIFPNISKYHAYLDKYIFEKIYGVFLITSDDPAPFVQIQTMGKK